MRKVHILIIFLQNKDLIARTNIRVKFNTWQSVQEILSLTFSVSFARKIIESWYKTNCDTETAILHYVDSVGEK